MVVPERFDSLWHEVVRVQALVTGSLEPLRFSAGSAKRSLVESGVSVLTAGSDATSRMRRFFFEVLIEISKRPS